ncbi:MAG TPA: MlaD family protein, partial [Thermoanaerobaculia bacterium]|nr:MlaD family protein [Thermoanaerobaculia bacterium]
MSPRGGREARVGLVILAALVVLAAGIFLIGDKNNLFSKKHRYFVEFNSVSGLKPGSPVQLDGVDVGTIEEVNLPRDPNRKQIQVWISVDRRYAERIRGPVLIEGRLPPLGRNAPPSQARIKTLGLLGDKFIELSSGAAEFPLIPTDGQIPAAQPTNVDALLASGEDVMDNVVEISASLSDILGRMERGEGLLGELTSNSPSGERLKNSLIGTSETLQRIANKIETGDGPLPRLLNDRAMADQLTQSLDRLNGLLASAQTGPGLLPGLLNDPATKAQFDQTLASLNQVARDLQGFTADLEKSDALLPKLVKDEEYGREITDEIRDIVNRLDTISVRLTEGKGTAAKLINDPQVYEAVNDILIGVNESRFLRWLIRNRQNAGIKKRYDDTRDALEQSGQTPPPLEGAPGEGEKKVEEESTGTAPPPAESAEPAAPP